MPRGLGIRYLSDKWPRVRFENRRDTENPAAFGWISVDDQWNDLAHRADQHHGDGTTAFVTFRPLRADGFADLEADYDVRFRRTLGLRVVVADPGDLLKVAITTRSAPARTTVRVVLDAGKKTAGRTIRLSAYNARIVKVVAERA